MNLLKWLVESEPKPHYIIAREMGVHPSTLSRAANNLCDSNVVFEAAASYFKTIGSVEITPHLLQTTITPRQAVEVACVIRNRERAAK